MVGLLIAAILLGMHVGVALGSLSFLGVWWIKDNPVLAMNLIGSTAYVSTMEYVLAVLPMFIIMGLFGNLSGASDDLYDSANSLLGRIRGGLGIATVFANAVFAAITGSSAASAAVFSKIAYPQMKRLGYEKKFSMGTIIGSSVLGMLIPPSAQLIIYGFLTEVSIGKLFMAGLIPGILLTFIFSAGIWLMVTANPSLAGEIEDLKKLNLREVVRIILKPWIFVFLVFLVLGGIYLGWFSPTEAGAVGAFGALIFSLIRRKVKVRSLWQLLLDAGYTIASVLFLFICAQMYSRMLAISTLPSGITRFIVSLQLPPYMVIILFIIIFVLLGALLDSLSISLICIPIMFPIVTSLGYDPIWFGIISAISIEMGLLTPPFGMCVYVMKSALGDEVTIEEGFRGSFPFLLMMVICLILVFIFPSLSTWLPGLM